MDHKLTQAISKSKFIAGAQCLKRLYLQVHQPELAGEPDAATVAIMEQGREVGPCAGSRSNDHTGTGRSRIRRSYNANLD